MGLVAKAAEINDLNFFTLLSIRSLSRSFEGLEG